MIKEFYARMEALVPSFLDSEHPEYIPGDVEAEGFIYLYKKQDFYIPASLILNQLELNKTMQWVLWTKVKPKDFLEMTENLSGPISVMPARLYNPISFYDNTENLEILLQFELKEKIQLPKIKILNNHKKLFLDFKNGVSKEKYLKWQEKLNG